MCANFFVKGTQEKVKKSDIRVRKCMSGRACCCRALADLICKSDRLLLLLMLLLLEATAVAALPPPAFSCEISRRSYCDGGHDACVCQAHIW